ncbi:MAG: DUF2922 domain-containing protein [Eubacteriaceae bacterium]
MATVKLDMTFKRADNGSSKISINDARSDITGTETNDLMDLIVTNDVFEPNGSSLIEKSKAELITTEVVEFTLL